MITTGLLSILTIVASESVNANASMVLTITGKTQMAKGAQDASPNVEKNSKRKRKKTSGKSGIYVRNYFTSFLSQIHRGIAFKAKAFSEGTSEKTIPLYP